VERTIELADHHSLAAGQLLAHVAVPFGLADSLSAAALASVEGQPGPTQDVRIDSLRPATGTIYGEAEEVRYGEETGVVECELADADGNHIAATRGVYKTDLVGGDNPFTE
jgi:uncharacterized protein (TIGR00369 family)